MNGPEAAAHRDLAGALRRARFDVRMWLGRQQAGHRIVAWWNWTRIRESQALVTRRTELVMDGFPSSGNSFAIAALKLACSAQAVALPRVAHHLHNPGQVRKAVRRGIPTLLLVREPCSTVVSALSRWPALRAEQVLRHYVSYHEQLRDCWPRMVIADFGEVSSDFGAVTRRLNSRYGLTLPVFEHTSAAAELVYDRDEPARAARRAAGEALRARLDGAELRPILQTAMTLHDDLIAHRHRPVLCEPAERRPSRSALCYLPDYQMERASMAADWGQLRQTPSAPLTTRGGRRGDPSEEATFLGLGERVFATTCLPGPHTARSDVGVVICPSIGHELITNYRREVSMGRALGAAGFPTARLQYRGAGNSDGCAEAMDRTSMCDDVMLVVDHLRTTSSVTSTVVLGTRFGSLVAASVATALGGAPVVCLSPVLSVRQYLREGFRAKRMQDVGNSRSGASPTDPAEELERTGSIDVLGIPIFKRFCDSWADTTLARELAVADRVLLVHMGGRAKLAGLKDLAAELDARGLTTTVVQAETDEAWWYVDEQELQQVGRQQTSEGTSAVGAPPAPSAIQQIVEWVASLTAVHG